METEKNKIKMERAIIDSDLAFMSLQVKNVDICWLHIMQYMFENEYFKIDKFISDYESILFDENGLKICRYYRFNLYAINDIYISAYYFRRIVINATSDTQPRKNKIINYFSKRLNLKPSLLKKAFLEVAILEQF